MAQSAIVEKLNRELAIPIESERQVAYILVETRKLLDLVEMGDVYEQLYFFCIWALHHLVKKKSAREIVKLFDTMVTAESGGLPTASDIANNPKSMVEHLAKVSAPFNLIGFADFKRQLVEFLRRQNINCHLLEADQQWIKFLKYYSAVVEDCHLLCLDNSSALVKRVVVRKVQEESYSSDVQVCLRLVWVWVHDDNTESTLIYSTLVYPLEGG